MNRRIVPALRGVAAGALFGCGIGLGAANGWLMALLLAAPLIVGGVVIAPRPSRISELPVWALATPGVGALATAITRSDLGDVDRQPSLITAMVSPPDDTEYEARWMVSMTRAETTTLLTDRRIELPDVLVPPRERSTPEFDDVPGLRVLVFPIITLLVMAGLAFGVPMGTWHMDLSSGSDPASSRSGDDITAARLDAVREHAATLSPDAASNILKIDLTREGSDSVDVFDPTTGEVISAYRSNGEDDWMAPTRRIRAERGARAFALSDLDRFDLQTLGPRLLRAVAGAENRIRQLAIGRAREGQPVLATATIGPSAFDETDLQVAMSGAIAERFDPGDLSTSMRIASDAIADAKLSTSDPILTRFEIRGTREGTPIMRAGSIQNSGGVLIEYSTATVTGQIIVRPGQFPTSDSPSYENKAGRLPRGGVAFDQLSAAMFSRIRDDVMRRGAVAAFDRTAVDLQVTQGGSDDDYGPVIFAAVGPSPVAVGTYDLAAQFRRPRTY